jgi:CBS domain-containing protein
MLIREAAVRPPLTIDCASTIVDAARMMDQYAAGALVVLDGERPVGIVTDRDLVVRALARRVPPGGRVDSVMSTDLVTLSTDDDWREVYAIFRRHAIRRMPVLADGRLVGLITTDDLLADLVNELGDLARPITGEALFAHAEPALPATIN